MFCGGGAAQVPGISRPWDAYVDSFVAPSQRRTRARKFKLRRFKLNYLAGVRAATVRPPPGLTCPAHMLSPTRNQRGTADATDSENVQGAESSEAKPQKEPTVEKQRGERSHTSSCLWRFWQCCKQLWQQSRSSSCQLRFFG